ncbi:hypothetical protein GQ54DRAFT_323902 [Martensiomyces pterosporus]|nr:hypothetical protein GQ54DRAFT_323902 [Martensiomyces pterosporus]
MSAWRGADSGEARQMSLAWLPSAAFGRSVLAQAHAYARDRAKGCMDEVSGTINRHYALVSTFNDTWIALFRDKDDQARKYDRLTMAMAKSSCHGAALELREAGSSTDTARLQEQVEATARAYKTARAAYESAHRAEVSTRFSADNSRPHIAFVVAYVLHAVIEDMVEHPDDYPKLSFFPRAANPAEFPQSPTRKGSRAPATKSRGTKQKRKSAGPSGKGKKPDANSEAADLELTTLAAQCRSSAWVETLLSCPNKLRSSPTLNSSSSMLGGGSSSIRESKIWSQRNGSWRPLSGHIQVDAQVGNGRSGLVCRGWVNGRPVALKLCPGDVECAILDELFNEVQVYQHLRDLQGDAIPRLVEHGLVEINGRLYVALVLELIEDALFEGVMDASREEALRAGCDDDLKRAVLAVLEKIHSRGVANGDPRAYNVLFEAGTSSGTALRPRIFDLVLRIFLSGWWLWNLLVEKGD